MKKRTQVKEERFEFVFYINDNIIVQRFFKVHRYNNNFKNSFEAKELMDQVMGMNNGDHGSLGLIPDSFKEQSMLEMWRGYNPYVEQNADDIHVWDLFSRTDDFKLEIKVDKETVVEGHFCGNYFPTSVRHYVNINPIISDIISLMRQYMSLNSYNVVENATV